MVIGISLIAVVVCAVAILNGKSFGDLLLGIASIGNIPEGSMKELLPLLGWSGEGAIGTALYSAWIKEKGYGLGVGDRANLTTAEIEQGKTWLKVMRTDALISFVIQGLACLAFMIGGAVILHPLGLVPEGINIAKEQVRLFTTALGPWANYLYIVAAATAMFTTLMVAIDCEARVTQDFLERTRAVTRLSKETLYRYTLIFAVVLTILFSLTKAPLPLLKFGSVFDGTIMLPLAGLLTLYANKKLLPPELAPSGWVLFFTALGIGVMSIFMFAALFWVKL